MDICGHQGLRVDLIILLSSPLGGCLGEACTACALTVQHLHEHQHGDSHTPSENEIDMIWTLPDTWHPSR